MQGFWREVWEENRKIIFGMTILVVLLIIAIIVVTNLNRQEEGVVDKGDYTAGYIEIQDEAEESELDVNSYLAELHGVIKNELGEKLDGYEIATGKLLGDGDWYVTTIRKPLKSQWSLATDVYRVILKNDGGWKMMAGPNLVFAYMDYPEIPKEVIASANNL